MGKYSVCVHAHFYQPSREDPLTGVIPDESGSEPYPNWNERVNACCYKPNAELGNFEKISFNIGPTLVRWMEKQANQTLKKIVSSDNENYRRFGVGNALAQPYHHTILPLASSLDKVTQVQWGITDFCHTFGHRPEGMWLPETAVDMQTLEVLAEQGIKFTILAPWQAESENLDVSHPYQVDLPSGKTLAVFFYHSGLSGTISFDPSATTNADAFIQTKLVREYSNNDEDQFILLASDGELYGHHQTFRDKFLNHFLNGALVESGIEKSYPGLWLKDHPAKEKIRIREKSSWSCSHGVARWEDSCDCTPGADWKRPLRNFLNATADAIDYLYMQEAGQWLDDIWLARNDYIRVILGMDQFSFWAAKHGKVALSDTELEKLDVLMKAQFERQRMFTSCGWFFDEFNRIEPRNNILYAASAVAYAQRATGKTIVEKIAPNLEQVKSRKTGLGGKDLFLKAVDRFQTGK